MKTSVINNQNLYSGVPYSTVKTLIYLLVLQSALSFQSELNPPTVWLTSVLGQIKITRLFYFFRLLSVIMISYGVEETEQLYASGLTFWNLCTISWIQHA